MKILDFNEKGLNDLLIVENGDQVTMVSKGPMLEFSNKIVAYYYVIGEIESVDIKQLIKTDKTLPEVIGYYSKYSNGELKLVLFRSINNDEA